MVWAHVYGSDGKLLLVCPAEDAAEWWLLHGSHLWRYILIEEAPCP